ncbi:hypothetical protein RB595_006574 [Gaeumannomyces hyphopodioides]
MPLRPILRATPPPSIWRSTAPQPASLASWARSQSHTSARNKSSGEPPSPPPAASEPPPPSCRQPPLRDGRPLRMAVVGSGPAGFYTAHRVMSKLRDTRVDMYEALPVPFGLVRFGVAPDHPEVKNCQARFDEIASSPNFTFVGNMAVGAPSGHPGGGSLPLRLLMCNYDAIVFAYGAGRDRTLGIPGEDLAGVHSARQFVGWYNGLPEHADLDIDLTVGEEAVIIGQGNVALDVARILLTDVDVLRKTDIAEHAIEALSRSRVKRVHVVGRRGPMQAAFTIKEARELMKLPNVGFHGVVDGLIPPNRAEIQRPLRRLMELLLEGSPSSPAETPKSWSLDFCLRPFQFRRRQDDPTRLGSVEFQRTILRHPFDPDATAFQTPATGPVKLRTPFAFKSIGYRGEPLSELTEVGVSFDHIAGVFTSDRVTGRIARWVTNKQYKENLYGSPVQCHYPGLYCAGWVKRGPTGVIASTMQDAFTTADAILEDWQTGAEFLPFDGDESTPRPGWDAISRLEPAAKAKVVSWEDWRRIDQVEKERGRLKGKEREKLPTTLEMLSVIS